MRDFSQKVYDTNGATPKQNAINQMNARIATQSKISQTGGAGVVVPQTVNARHQVSPENPNTNNERLISAQLRMDSAAKAQANTGQKIGGKRKNKTKKNRKNKRKSRKY
uniref:Uncharacterized protein n=1 Tax=viral metagenome TaxID=1070528 RepID=A0A6C0BAF5_9ZZZZ